MKKMYLCTGANWINGFAANHCGEIHSLDEWVRLLWGDKADGYFDGWTDAEIVRYVYDNAGKRLERIKK